MNSARVLSFPDLASTEAGANTSEESSLEGITANVKLLLKLLNDHHEASQKGYDPRQGQRLAGMMSILDDVKGRIQRSQMSGKKKQAELRRCNTDLKGSRPATGKHAPALDDKERLRRDLNMSFAAQKRLGVMCSSLGKEKQIIARELSRKVQELQGMEELLNDYREQNARLADKAECCRVEHSEEMRAVVEAARAEAQLGRGMLEGLRRRLGGGDVGAELEEIERVVASVVMRLSI